MTADQAYGNMVTGGFMLVCWVACVAAMLMDRWMVAGSRSWDSRLGALLFFPPFGIVIGFCVLLTVVAVLRNMGYDLPVFRSAAWASELR